MRKKRPTQQSQKCGKKLIEAARPKMNKNPGLSSCPVGFSKHEVFVDQEKDMKEAADATLSEVRKKLSEARKCREVLQKLGKLRQVRKDAMERMGRVLKGGPHRARGGAAMHFCYSTNRVKNTSGVATT